jgi:hypothetical protein
MKNKQSYLQLLPTFILYLAKTVELAKRSTGQLGWSFLQSIGFKVASDAGVPFKKI